jgi:amino acid transporter
MVSSLHAGPYVSVSYLLAGLACLLSAFCYAEFSSRVKSSSGSSYSFVYYALGELVAFFIGWMLFVGSVASISANSLTWSSYFDSMTNYAVKNFTIEYMHASWNIGEPFSSYFDIPATLILILLFLVSLIGIKMTTLFNNSLAILNIGLLIAISLGGFFYGKFENLSKTAYKNGLNGIIRGSSIVMYAYFGFESSTFAIDEAINPTRNFPLSLVISLLLICLVYCSSSLALNLMQPFDQIDLHASFPTAFKSVKPLYWLVSVGPIISITGSLIAGIYSLARIVYTMANDGLLFKYLAKLHHTYKVPHLAIFTSMFACIGLVVLFDVKDLIGFADISGFLIYSVIALALLVIRYCHDSNDDEQKRDLIEETSSDLFKQEENILNEIERVENQDERENLLDNISRVNQEDSDRSNRSLSFIKKRQFFRSRKNALFIILFIFFINMLMPGFINMHIGSSKLLFVLIIFINAFLTILLSLFEQTDRAKEVKFKVRKIFLKILLII